MAFVVINRAHSDDASSFEWRGTSPAEYTGPQSLTTVQELALRDDIGVQGW
jgi:hypothetical protein